MTAADERQLVADAKEGNRQAFRQLVERHMRQAYNVAFGFVGNHEQAQDVTQEALVRAYRGLGSFRGDAEFGTWLHRIVTNLSLNVIASNRRSARREVRDIDAVMAAHNDPEEHSQQHETARHIERALHELPTRQRAVVILRHLNGLSTKQVSSILRCSEATVKTHLFRGLKRLRSSLAYLQEDGT